MEQKPFPGLRADQAFTYNGPDEMFVQEPDGTIWRIGLTKKPSKQVMERVVFHGGTNYFGTRRI